MVMTTTVTAKQMRMSPIESVTQVPPTPPTSARVKAERKPVKTAHGVSVETKSYPPQKYVTEKTMTAMAKLTITSIRSVTKVL